MSDWTQEEVKEIRREGKNIARNLENLEYKTKLFKEEEDSLKFRLRMEFQMPARPDNYSMRELIEWLDQNEWAPREKQ